MKGQGAHLDEDTDFLDLSKYVAKEATPRNRVWLERSGLSPKPVTFKS